MKIILVGTFPPFRGGIANFYHTLAEKLSNAHNVSAINFTTQYPNILFPGKSQYEENVEQTNYTSERMLSTINPFTWAKTAERIIDLKPDIIIFKYWMPYFAPSFGFILKKVKKEIGVKSLVICDNIVPHEGRALDETLTKYFFNNVDYFMVMSKAVENELLSFYPNADYVYTPHPLFDLFGEQILKNDAKSLIGIKEEKMLLYFGLIRTYKGLDLLIEAAGKLKKKLQNFKILAVGDCYDNPDHYRKLIKIHEVGDIFDLRMEFVPNDQVYKYFSAADAIVLPYKSATQSGIVPIAYHFNKPVIITDVGGLKEIVRDGKTGLVVEPDADHIANGIIKFYNIWSETDFDSDIEEFKQQFSWSVFINKLEQIIGD